MDLTLTTPAGPRTLTTTTHHLFWNATTHHWTQAVDLHPGDHLQTTHGRTITLNTTRHYTATTLTYDLTINHLHTYYVLAEQAPVLVHNCIPGYENPGHHDPHGGPNSYNPNKGVLPADAEEQFQNSVLVDGTRWAKIGSGRKAVYYRYSNDAHGNWHWSGSSNGRDNRGNPVEIPLRVIPIEVRRR